MPDIPISGSQNWSTCNGGDPPGPPAETDRLYLQAGSNLTLNAATCTCEGIYARASSGGAATNGVITPNICTTLNANITAGTANIMSVANATMTINGTSTGGTADDVTGVRITTGTTTVTITNTKGGSGLRAHGAVCGASAGTINITNATGGNGEAASGLYLYRGTATVGTAKGGDHATAAGVAQIGGTLTINATNLLGTGQPLCGGVTKIADGALLKFQDASANSKKFYGDSEMPAEADVKDTVTYGGTDFEGDYDPLAVAEWPATDEVDGGVLYGPVTGEEYEGTGMTPQQVVKELNHVTGTVYHITYAATEDGMANDGLSWATAKSTAGAGVKTVVEGAAANDLVLLGPGTFTDTTTGITMNCSIRGAGKYATTLYNTNAGTSGFALAVGASGLFLEDCSVKCVKVVPIGWGAVTRNGFAMRRVYLEGFADCFLAATGTADLLYGEDVTMFVSVGDSGTGSRDVVWTNFPSRWLRCQFTSLATTAQYANCFKLNAAATLTELIDCRLNSSGASVSNVGLRLLSSNNVYVSGTTIRTQGTGAYEISGSGNVYSDRDYARVDTATLLVDPMLARSPFAYHAPFGVAVTGMDEAADWVYQYKPAGEVGGKPYFTCADTTAATFLWFNGTDWYISADNNVTGTDYYQGGTYTSPIGTYAPHGTYVNSPVVAGIGPSGLADKTTLDVIAVDVAGLNGASMAAPPSASTIASQVRTELTTELTRIDATITSRHASGAAVAKSPATLNWSADVSSKPTIGTSTFDPTTQEVTPTAASKTGYALAATGLDAITATAPATLATTFPQKLLQVWERFFGKVVKTSTTIKTYASDGTTTVTTQNISESGTTETQGKAS